jgi:glyceraldehyde 3-phosphate dehydrogenase
VPVVSIVDLTVTLERDVTVEEVNNAFRRNRRKGPLKGILGYSDEPLVSSDYQETHARLLSTAYQRW